MRETMNTNEMQCHFVPLYQSFLLKANIGENVVEELNTYLDALQKQAKVVEDDRMFRPMHIMMKSDNPNCIRFANICLGMSHEYMRKYFKLLGREIPAERMPEVDEMWSVHSHAGDYNILHSHETKTLMGLSCVTWTKVPKPVSYTHLTLPTIYSV